MSTILILGGYGNFGKRIAHLLTRQNIPVTIVGRDHEKAHRLVKELPEGLADVAIFDVRQQLAQQLQQRQPAVVINTCGPFQNSDYTIAEICIAARIHYIDLADGRDFVTGITALDAQAQDAEIAVISGASTVPGLSSAVIEHLLPEFSELDSLKFGIAPGQKAERGLATTQAILSYVGKKLKLSGNKERYGWQDVYLQPYPDIGSRWMANCDIPDLDLFPSRYNIKQVHFSAGMENPLVHFGVWTLSWLVRAAIIKNLPRYASLLLKASNWFDFFGTSDGGMHLILEGKDLYGHPLKKTWYIIALEGDGPYIPTIPAVILAKKIWNYTLSTRGAMPCLGLITLAEYMAELSHQRIKIYEYSEKQ